MRRHLPVLANAFRFYGLWFASVTALVAVGLALVAGLTVGWEYSVAGLPVLLVGLAMGALYVRVARGLDERRGWARYLALALSVTLLGDLPFGIPLGLLGLGVLCDKQAAAEF